jgi:hypothetical protein
MDLHQFQATYQREQDRILLRLNTRTNEEVRLWFTRRMLTNFYPHLVKSVRTMGNEAVQAISHDGGPSKDLAGFRQQETLAKADFSTPFNDVSVQYPAGIEPLLVTQIQVTQLANQTIRIAFEEKMPAGESVRKFEVSLALTMVQALQHLLEVVLKQSDWGIQAQPLPTAALDESEPADALELAQRPVYLN